MIYDGCKETEKKYFSDVLKVVVVVVVAAAAAVVVVWGDRGQL